MIIAYLKDTDSNYYEDGTPAKLDGTEGDIMVDFPEFYYKWEQMDANKFRYRFALSNIDGNFKYIPRSLVGAYKACLIDDKIYSHSGVMLNNGGITYTKYVESAIARGQGYQIIDFQHHCIIAFMLYAKYGNRDLQAILGVGNGYDINTGTTNRNGNRDTSGETSGFVNGLGLEGVFGGYYEWVQGVSILDYVWTISDPDGTQRNIEACRGSGVIGNVAAENGPFFDMVPITYNNASTTTRYTDQYNGKIGGPFILARSGLKSSVLNGVALINAEYSVLGLSSNFVTRLAFRGVIHQAESVNVFKSISIL